MELKDKNSGAHDGAVKTKKSDTSKVNEELIADIRILSLLNDIGWHSIEIRRLTHELSKIGVRGDEIESYMDDYLQFVADVTNARVRS